VGETAGETLWFGSHRAQVFYTQHCGGMTEDAQSLWQGENLPYLKSHPDPYCLRRQPARWHAEISQAQMLSIAHKQGWRFPSEIERMNIVSTTSSGRANLIEVEGNGAHGFVSASSLRFAIDRGLGWNLLRSDWFTVSVVGDEVRFVGKGYGHGVGLCQAGAYEMAVEGHLSNEILDFYFPGTQIRIGPFDHGWRISPGDGWLLTATDISPSLIHAGNAAWDQARALFPPRAQLHPVVRLFPSTELFRQISNEPGWILAASRDDEVYLQPQVVLNAQGGAEVTLRHEFLHLLVEREAAPKTPLWLREGLVEYLNHDSIHTVFGQAFASSAALDDALEFPASRQAAEQAHAAARSMAGELIARYGLNTVRNWLQTEVPDSVVRQMVPNENLTHHGQGSPPPKRP
jgi:stage II sporulation protein D